MSLKDWENKLAEIEAEEKVAKERVDERIRAVNMMVQMLDDFQQSHEADVICRLLKKLDIRIMLTTEYGQLEIRYQGSFETYVEPSYRDKAGSDWIVTNTRRTVANILNQLWIHPLTMVKAINIVNDILVNLRKSVDRLCDVPEEQ